MLKSEVYKYIKNIFLSGWCADAVGSRLEFRKRTFTSHKVFDAMHFIGETTGGTYPGQYTDDSEMEIALLNGIIEGQHEDLFPVEHIAQSYIKWYKSEPFDMGQSVRNALLGAFCAEDLINNSYEFNNYSQSNGSLMRCIPLALLSVGKTFEEILELVECEVILIHSSKIVLYITALYCFLISQIILYVLQQNTTNISLLIDETRQLIINVLPDDENSDLLLEWFNQGINLTNICNYNAITNEGHVKHAFIMVIYFLNNINNYSYERAIKEVLMLGGDTDTNAKIVGNLFGAYYNDCIPEYMLKPVLKFDCTTECENFYFLRPIEYGINNGLHLVDKFVDILKF